MAHITDISIEGLLGRREPINLTLNRGVNIFFGENGCGKTTLLKILDAALSKDGAAMEKLPLTRASVGIYSISERKVFTHTWERRSAEAETSGVHSRYIETLDVDVLDGSETRFLTSHTRTRNPWKVTPSEENPTNRWMHTFLPTTRLYFNDAGVGRVQPARTQGSEKELDQAFSDSVNKAWLQFFSRTLTEVRDIQESGLRAVLKHVLNPAIPGKVGQARDAGPVYDRVANFLNRHPQSEQIKLGSRSTFKERYENDSNLRTIVDNLDEVERSIEQAMVPVNRFFETITKLFSRGKQLGLTDSELQIHLTDGRILPIAQLSSGEKHLIKILLTSMTAGPHSMLIDEPELSLHLDWQRSFVETVRSLNPFSQLILASHSPEVMAEVSDECIFKL